MWLYISSDFTRSGKLAFEILSYLYSVYIYICFKVYHICQVLLNLWMQSVVMHIKQNLINHMIWYRKSHGSKRKSSYIDHSFLLNKSTYMSCILTMKIWKFSILLLNYRLRNTQNSTHDCTVVVIFYHMSDQSRYQDTLYVKWKQLTLLKGLFMIAWQTNMVCLEKQ